MLVDLRRGDLAGGHVKCWERFAEAAVGVDELDLTLYVLGRRGGVDQLSDTVRFRCVPPVFSTSLLTGLVGGVDDSDLSPFSPGLARRLPEHEVWHATHSLAFGATAARLSRRIPRAMVSSIHTDVPLLTEIYATQVRDRLGSAAARALLRRAGMVERAVAATRRRRNQVLTASEHVLVSSAADRADVAQVVPPDRISLLRRGVDLSRFGPDPGARERLQRRYGVPAGAHLVLLAGRVDATKGVMVLADAVRRLRDRGVDVHLVVAGGGVDAHRVKELVGADATLLGPVLQADLAGVYAACDVLAFPSLSDTAGNVVVEAMASGLPVVLARGSRTNGWLTAPGHDGVLVDGVDPDRWACELQWLLGDRARREAIARRALASVRTAHPSWREVLMEDLLPVWRAAAQRQRARVRTA